MAITMFCRSPAPDSEWPRYRAGEAHVHNIQDALCGDHLTNRDVAFWLQYLPNLVDLVTAAERTEQLPMTGGKNFQLVTKQLPP